MSEIRLRRSRPLRYAAGCVLLIVAFVVALSACGSSSNSTTGTSATQSGTPQRGGTLVMTFQAEPVTLDPAVDFEGPGWAMEHCLFGNLLNYSSGPGAAGTKIIADMATVVPTVANGGITNGGKTYIFHIRPGIKFAPPVSREVTAQDFVYSFQRMMSLPAAPAKGYYSGIVGLQAFLNGKAKTITGYKATDNYTLEVDLQKPVATFLNIMEMPFSAPVAKEWVAKWGSQIGRHPLGTGPYMLEHWVPSQDLVLKRNPNYTGTGGLRRQHAFRVLDHADDRHPQGPERRRRHRRRLHPAGQLPAADRQSAVEEPGRSRTGRRAQLPVHEHHRQAIRQPACTAGHRLVDRSRQDRQAALGHRHGLEPDLPRRPARSCRRRRRQLLRLRPGQGQEAPHPGRLPQTASRRRSTRATSRPGRRSSSPSSTTSRRSA